MVRYCGLVVSITVGCIKYPLFYHSCLPQEWKLLYLFGFINIIFDLIKTTFVDHRVDKIAEIFYCTHFKRTNAFHQFFLYLFSNVGRNISAGSRRAFCPWNSKAPRKSAVATTPGSALLCAITKSFPPVSPTIRG